MTQEFIRKILNKYEKANTIKDTWNSIYDEIYSYIIPNRGTAYETNLTKGTREIDKIKLYSSIAINSGNKFVNRIQELVSPINTKWIGLTLMEELISKEESGEIKKINDYLENNICEPLNNIKNCSNFDSVISEFYYDLIAGTACLLILPGDNNNPVIFKTIPFREYCLMEGYDGIVREVYRKFELKKKDIFNLWKNKKYLEEENSNTDKEEELYEIIEAVNYNYESKRWDYYVIDRKENNIIYYKQYKNNPFIILRWNKASGEFYGRGVGYTALPDVKTLNKIMDYSLRVLAYQLPIFLAEKESFDDDFLLEPMAINYVQSNEINKPSLTQLQIQGNNDITQYNIAQLEMGIKKIMLDNTLPDDTKVRTATEIAERKHELQSNLTSVFGRIVIDFLYPFIKRFIEILQLFNYIDPSFNIDDINGYKYKVNIKTSLSRQSKLEEQQNTLQAIQTLLNIDNTGNLLKKYLKVDNLFINFLINIGIDTQFIKSIEEINLEQQLQQEQQIQANKQLQQEEIESSNEKALGKARARALEKSNQLNY